MTNTNFNHASTVNSPTESDESSTLTNTSFNDNTTVNTPTSTESDESSTLPTTSFNNASTVNTSDTPESDDSSTLTITTEMYVSRDFENNTEPVSLKTTFDDTTVTSDFSLVELATTNGLTPKTDIDKTVGTKTHGTSDHSIVFTTDYTKWSTSDETNNTWGNATNSTEVERYRY